jgi:G6PDH family F420-dependent oxidoreductase
MLEEAVALIRELWSGNEVTRHGEHFTVENARLYDVPEQLPPIVVSAFGSAAAETAARCGDGLWTSSGNADVVDRFRAGGGHGPVFAQITLCWADDADQALGTAHRLWPNTAVPGQLTQDLPTPAHFEQAVSIVPPEMIAESVPCGPDPDPVLERVRQALEIGVDHLYFHQIGPDQEGFLRFWDTELSPALQDAIDLTLTVAR